LKEAFKQYVWPFGILSAVGGIIIVRSLLFGSLFGIVTGKVGKNLFNKYGV
jgi:hypothetical protein